MPRKRDYLWLTVSSIFWGCFATPVVAFAGQTPLAVSFGGMLGGIGLTLLSTHVLAWIGLLRRPGRDRPLLVFLYPLAALVLGALAVFFRTTILHEY